MSVSRDFIDPCSPDAPAPDAAPVKTRDSPPGRNGPPLRSVPEQCLVFGFHISSLVQGVDILVQDILVGDILFKTGCGSLPRGATAAPDAAASLAGPRRAANTRSQKRRLGRLGRCVRRLCRCDRGVRFLTSCLPASLIISVTVAGLQGPVVRLERRGRVF